MNPRYPLVAERAGHRCEYCRAPEAAFNFPLEVEHIVPASCGGSDRAVNWALACRACNVFKSDHVQVLDPDTQETLRLFDPRQDTWEEHFRVDTDTAVVVGLTPVGRATVARLQMNRPVHVRARHQWIRLGFFP
jgi:hypothetical protein